LARICQRLLRAALKRQTKQARSPNVLTRQRDNADEDLIVGVAIEKRRGNHAPASPTQMNRQPLQTSRVAHCPYIVTRNGSDPKKGIVVAAVIWTRYDFPNPAVPWQAHVRPSF